MAFRYDTVKLGPPRRLDDGRLIVEATLTRTGIFVYRNPDGSERREYRDEATISPKALESLKLAPVTNDHPPVMVTAENADKYVVGQVGESVRRDGDHVVATIVINHADAIRDMERGKRDTSCGYACELDETPGVTPAGERYDARQTQVEYNHLAIVGAGRAGSSRARMDSLEEVRAESNTQTPPESSGVVDPNRADSAPSKEPIVEELKKALAEVAEQTKRANDEKVRADAATEKTKTLELELAKVESEKAAETKRADAEKTRADEATKARKDADDAFNAKVQERADLHAQAVEFLGRNDKGEVLGADGKTAIDIKKMDARAIKVVVVEKLDGIKIDEKRSDDAVSYAYELATKRAEQSSAAMGAARQVITGGRIDAAPGAGDAEAKAKAAMQERTRNAHKKETK